MHRRLIIASVVVAIAVCAGVIAFIRPPPAVGQFPPGFSDAEKRQIVSAANNDALKQTLKALGHARFAEARRWIFNARKQTVRNVGEQGQGKIWVSFGLNDPAATDGYAIWARYVMKQENGRWVIDKPLF